MKRVIALLMENQPGALSRVVGLFSHRGYNIETLIVAPTTDPTLSRLTMSTNGDEDIYTITVLRRPDSAGWMVFCNYSIGMGA